jgi:site-specific DNA recombinase
MKAALYARKSSVTGDREETRSTTRQLEDARAFAASRGWTVAGEYVEPEGTSGGTFERPEFQRMLADARAGAFDVVVVFDLSRFSRADPVDALIVLRQLGDAGVTVWDASTAQALDADSEMGALVTHVGAISTAAFRKMIGKTVRAQKAKAARDGYVTGTLPLGYRAEGEHKAKRIVVVPREAALVRRIFAWYASGWTIAKITSHLNSHGVTSPKAHKGRTGWRESTVRQILGRDLYRGRIVIGRTAVVEGRALGRARRTVDGRTRSRAQVERPESDWTVVERPDLRIIDQTTINEVDRRLADREAGKHGRSFSTRRVPLLSGGPLVCALCGRRFETVRASSPNGIYQCSGKRRRLGCTNSTRVQIAAMDRAVIDALEDTFLSEGAVERVLGVLDVSPVAEREKLTAERDRLRAEACRLTEALATGEQPAAVVEAIRERETALRRVEAQLAERPVEMPDRAALRAALRTQAGDWRRALASSPAVARLMISRFIGPIRLGDEGPAPDHLLRWESRAILPNSSTSA